MRLVTGINLQLRIKILFASSFLVCLFVIITNILSIDGTSWLKFVGDDSFYYLSVVDVFSSTQRLSATIDPIEITNGFHILWFVFLYILRTLLQLTVWDTFLVSALVNTAIWGFITIFIYRFGRGTAEKVIGAIASASLITAPGLQFVSLSGIESVLYCFLFLALGIRLTLHLRTKMESFHFFTDFALVLVLFTARTEGAIFATFYCLFLLTRNWKKVRLLALCWAVIVGLWLLSNQLIFGNYSQSSTLFYRNFYRPRSGLLDLIGTFIDFYDFRDEIGRGIFGTLIGNPLTNFCLIFIIYKGLRNRNKHQLSSFYSFDLDRLTAISIMMASNLVSIAYLVFVQGTPAFSRYKLSNLITFVLLYLLVISRLFEVAKERKFFLILRQRLVFSLLSVILVTLSLVTFGLLNFSNGVDMRLSSSFDERGMFWDVGQELGAGRIINSKSRVGSLNSGILGFSSGNRVINLDGRINSEIFRKTAVSKEPNSVSAFYLYLRANKIEYFIDGKEVPKLHMVDDYNTSRKCIKELLVFKEQLSISSIWYGGLALFEVSKSLPSSCS